MVRHDEMECVCGEVLRTEEQSEQGQAETGKLWEQYQEHMARPDHRPSGIQWLEAGRRIAEAREKAKRITRP
jgi:hypothetical protein